MANIIQHQTITNRSYKSNKFSPATHNVCSKLLSYVNKIRQFEWNALPEISLTLPDSNFWKIPCHPAIFKPILFEVLPAAVPLLELEKPIVNAVYFPGCSMRTACWSRVWFNTNGIRLCVSSSKLWTRGPSPGHCVQSSLYLLQST